MNKSILFLLCASTLSSAMDDTETKKESLYLVVGSTRDLHTVLSLPRFPFFQLWQENKSKLAHWRTYRGKVTTMDLMDIPLPLKHIVGDASTYDFKDRIIKAAYLERLPTLNLDRDCHTLQSTPTEKNYLGACIQNIGKAMEQDAVMEIEWHPYVQIFHTDPSNIKSLFCEKERQENPFTMSISLDFACTALEMACGKTMPPNGDIVSPQFILRAKELSMTFEKLLAFYEEKNIGTKALLSKRINEELWLWTTLLHSGEMALLSAGPSESLKDFSVAIKSLAFAKKDPTMVGKFSTVKVQDKEFSGTFYDADLFESNAFFNFMLCEAGIIHNSHYVKEFMETSGFKNVTIKRTTSRHNKRENVWIVKGKKA